MKIFNEFRSFADEATGYGITPEAFLEAVDAAEARVASLSEEDRAELTRSEWVERLGMHGGDAENAWLAAILLAAGVDSPEIRADARYRCASSEAWARCVFNRAIVRAAA